MDNQNKPVDKPTRDWISLHINGFWLITVLALPPLIVILWCNQRFFEPSDVLNICLIYAFVVLIIAALDAWKAYLWYLKTERHAVEQKSANLEQKAEQNKKNVDEERNKREAEKKLENLSKDVQDGLLRLAKELKVTREEQSGEGETFKKTVIHEVSNDVREKILTHFPLAKGLAEESKG